MRKVNLRFPERLLTRIDKQAVREGLERSSLIRTVMKRYLDEQDELARQARSASARRGS